jgi:hypothetical protein
LFAVWGISQLKLRFTQNAAPADFSRTMCTALLCRANPTSSCRSKATYRGLVTKLPGGGSELADAHSVIDSTLRDVAECVVLVLVLYTTLLRTIIG